MESSKSHWIVENDQAQNANEEFKGEIAALKRTRTAVYKDNDSHWSDFTIDEDSCESVDDTSTKLRKRGDSIADTKLRNFARMHTMRNIYARDQNLNQTKRQKKNVNIHVEIGRKGDTPTVAKD